MSSVLQSFTYHVAFVPQAGSAQTSHALWVAIPVALAIILALKRPPFWLGLLYVAFAAVCAFAMVSAERTWNRSVSAQTALALRAAEDSTTPVIEGRVTEFQPAPAEGHRNESFTVGGVHFEYSDYIITGGFN